MISNQVQRVYELTKQDTVFLHRLCESASVDELSETCSSFDIKITSEEAEELFTGISNERNKQTDELAELDLENVSGGVVVSTTTVVVVGACIFGLYIISKKLGKALSKH